MTNTTIRAGLDPATDWVGLADQIGGDLAPMAAKSDLTGQIDVAAFDRLRSSGLTAALVPTGLGGGGASHQSMGEALRAIGRHDPSVALTLSMHSHLVAAQVWRHKHGMDATSLLTRVAQDRIMLVSTGASDWVASNGTARKVDGGFVVSGRKAPASGCEIGDVLVTSFRWGDAADGPKVIHCSVPLSGEGVSIDLTWSSLGMRATGSHTVVIEDVFVPEEAVSLTRTADQWAPIWNIVMGAAIPLIMSVYLGAADRAVEIVLGQLADTDDATVISQIGEMMNGHQTAADLVAGMYAEADDLAFELSDEMSARILSRKTIVADSVISAVRQSIELLGGAGYSRDLPSQRILRDVQASVFHPLPRTRQVQFTGRVALGLPPVA